MFCYDGIGAITIYAHTQMFFAETPGTCKYKYHIKLYCPIIILIRNYCFCLSSDYSKKEFVLYNIFMYYCLLHVTNFDWLIDNVYHYDMVYT